MKRIESRDNPFYKNLLKLSKSSSERRKQRATLLDGAHLIEAFHASGGIADALILSDLGHTRTELRDLFDQCAARTRLFLSDRLFQEIAPVITPSGLLALISTPVPRDSPDVTQSCVMLETIQDPGNLGSILRSAAAAGMNQILLSKASVFAWSPKVLRAGMGAHFGLSIFEDMDLQAAAKAFSGIRIATDARATDSLFDADLSGPVAWMFGNEGAGLSAELGACVDRRLGIPMPGQAESLNIAAAAAICLFEQVRQTAQKR